MSREAPAPKARFRRFEGKAVKDEATGNRMNGVILREPMVVFRFLDGQLHGGQDTGGIAVESGTDGYYEKWERGKLKEAGSIMEDGNGNTWKEIWEKGIRKEYWENGVRITGENNNEEQ
jgi:hypothetical protein